MVDNRKAKLELATYVAQAFGAIPDDELVAEVRASNSIKNGDIGIMDITVVTIVGRGRRTYTAYRGNAGVELGLVMQEHL